MHRLGQRAAAGIGQSQRGDHRVAGARYVEHLARAGRHGGHLAGLLHQRHAAFGAGDEYRVGRAFGQQSTRRGGDLGLGAGRAAGGGGKFLEVRRDAGGPPVAGEIVGFGIDEHRHAGAAGRRDRVRHDRGFQRGLAVIRQDQRAATGEPGIDSRHQRRLFLGEKPGAAFVVGAHYLLAAGDEARLADRRPAGAHHQSGFDAGALLQDAAQPGARLVLADQADQDRARAERGDVARHVAGAARHFACFAQPDHRDRRFGRDTLDLAVQEAVQHDVAQAQNGQPGEIHRYPRRIGWDAALMCSFLVRVSKKDAKPIQKATIGQIAD